MRNSESERARITRVIEGIKGDIEECKRAIREKEEALKEAGRSVKQVGHQQVVKLLRKVAGKEVKLRGE